MGFFKRLFGWPLIETYSNGYTVRVEKSVDDRRYMLTIVNAQNILCGCNNTETLFEMKKMLKEVRSLPPNTLKAMPEFELDANGRMTQPAEEFVAVIQQNLPELIQKRAAVARAQEDLGAALAAYERGDYATALRRSQSLAEQGFPLAQTLRGFMYEEGTGVAQDYAEAMKWFRKAGDQADAMAEFKLGCMYEEGKGVPRDYANAIKWYRKAADQEKAEAQYNLGLMYYTGNGVSQDYTKAMGWLRKAADHGLVESQNSLGAMYDNGEGVPQDYVQAHKWFSLAAAGLPVAAHNRDAVAAKMTRTAQEPEWNTLSREIASLAKEEQYDRAIVVATKALQLAEQAFGSKHPNVALRLSLLAALYMNQGQYTQAESPCKRLLAITDRLPRRHRCTAAVRPDGFRCVVRSLPRRPLVHFRRP